MRKVRFYKYHGTGNDFILIDNRSQSLVFESLGQINLLCDRRFGIGADGLILLEESGSYDFRMKYYNSDGRESTMCGNGGRCLVAFANFLGIIGNSTRFEAIDGIHQAWITEIRDKISIVSLGMNDVKAIEKMNGAYVLNTGSPHYVSFCDSIQELNLVLEGRKIRNSDKFREPGINVNFITAHGNTFSMRTYERGVEDETWSCGTGTVAAAIAIELEGKSHSENPVVIQTRGGILKVSFQKKNNEFTDIRLIGPAEMVYEGIIEIN